MITGLVNLNTGNIQVLIRGGLHWQEYLIA